MKEILGYIYSITAPTGRTYVGFRKSKVWDEAYWSHSKNLEFWNDLEKFGKENFIREFWDWVYIDELLQDKENYYIIILCGLEKDGGYNKVLWKNQHMAFAHTGHKHSEETKEKLRQYFLGNKPSDEIKERQSIGLKRYYNNLIEEERLERQKKLLGKNKGKKSLFKGVPRSEETKEKISKKAKESYANTNRREKLKASLKIIQNKPEVKEKISKALKGRSFIELYGEERAKEIRKKQAETRKKNGYVPWNKGKKIKIK